MFRMDAGRAAVDGVHVALEALGSSTQIVPAIIGAEADALSASRRPLDAGILAVAIRPPPVHTATLRPAAKKNGT